MLRTRGRLSSSESAAELHAAAQEDLAKLQKDYKVTEKARKLEGDKAQNTLRKQNVMIEALQSENDELKKDLGLASSRQNELKNQQVRQKFEELITKQLQYKASLSEEERACEALEREIRAAEREMDRQRKEMGGVFVIQTQHIADQKQMRVMENRLDKALVRFNSCLATNAQSRERIDHFRQEKDTFEGMQQKLRKELVECKRAMGEAIDDSTRAHEARDDAQAKMLALKEKADKELAQYNTEMKELQRVLDHDRKLRDFMSRKNQERASAHEEIHDRRRRKETERASNREKTVMSYEQAFEKIKEATGITDIDQLVSKFIEVEDQNFALFNFVNELNSEIETIQEQIQQVHEDIARFQSQGVEIEEERKEILRKLEAELAEVTEETAKYTKNHAHFTRTLDQLTSGIDSLFNKIGCDAASIQSMLGGHAGVTSATILQYLGIVEQRTNELLQLQAFIQAKESGDSDAMAKFLMAHGGQSSLELASTVLPSLDDGYDSDGSDYDDKPLTQEELKAKALRVITRREAAKKQASLPPSSPHHSPSHPPPSTALTGQGRTAVSKKKRTIQTR